MTLAILIISFTITYYIYKKTYDKEKKYYLNEKLLLFMQLIACVVWFIISIIDYYNYGTLVFSPSVDIFIKDIFTGFLVLALSLFLWFLSIITSGKKIKNISIDKNKIREVLTNNKNIYEENKEDKNIKTTNTQHSAPNISVDYSTNSNDNNSRKGYFPYGHNPFRK